MTLTFILNVSWYANAIKSELAFDAEYGLFGFIGDVSVKYPSSPKVPYTSSVDICTNLFLLPSPHTLLAVSNNVCVPNTLVCVNTNGVFMLLSTCDSAAKCTTASILYFSKVSKTLSKSQISPFTNIILSFIFFNYPYFRHKLICQIL